MQIDLELLAPAKNSDIGIAAIDCGADALYIAGPSFGAREAAGNSIEEIARLTEYAKKYSVKVYLALNTIIYEHEIESAVKIAHDAAQAGIDALIIQDLGLLKAGLPDLPLHASTQTNIRTLEQAQFLERLGFERLILARELSIGQISEISQKIKAEIECFVHGALCVSYSGQCYMSSKMSGRSANRGECMQSCRMRYDLVDSSGNVIIKNRPLLSLKDLYLGNDIASLVKAGVTSFKIEGRLKNSSYIKNIVRHYRNKIDEFIASNPNYKKSSFGSLYGGFTPNPDYTFNRGYTTLFTSGTRGEWGSGEAAKGKGEQVGIINKVQKDSSGNFVFNYDGAKPINNGDGLFFITPRGEELGARAGSVSGNQVYTNEPVYAAPGSVVYRNYNHLFEKQLENNMPERLLKVNASLSHKNGITTLSAVCEDGRRVQIISPNNFESARNRELAKAGIKNQIGKKAEYFLFEADIEEDTEFPFYPAAYLNNLRREAANELSLQKVPEPDTKHRINPHRAKSIEYKGGFKDYRLNIANSFAKNLYRESGIEDTTPAYELEQPREAELMRTKYCLKAELGKCPMQKNNKWQIDEPLYLVNGKNRFRIGFDCRNCEMIIYG